MKKTIYFLLLSLLGTIPMMAQRVISTNLTDWQFSTNGGTTWQTAAASPRYTQWFPGRGGCYGVFPPTSLGTAIWSNSSTNFTTVLFKITFTLPKRGCDSTRDSIYVQADDKVNSISVNGHSSLGTVLGYNVVGSYKIPMNQLITGTNSIVVSASDIGGACFFFSSKIIIDTSCDKKCEDGCFWALRGNQNVKSTHFLGSKNQADLKFRTSNLERAVIKTTGEVGIGTNDPKKLLHVEGEARVANLPTRKPKDRLVFANEFGDLKSLTPGKPNQYLNGDGVWVDMPKQKDCDFKDDHHKRIQKLESDNEILSARLNAFMRKIELLEKTIIQICEQGCKGISSNKGKSKHILYPPIPNPSQREVLINYTLAEEVVEPYINLIDVNGKVLGRYDLNPVAGDGNIRIDVSSFNSGTVFYSLYDNGETVSTERLQIIK